MWFRLTDKMRTAKISKNSRLTSEIFGSPISQPVSIPKIKPYRSAHKGIDISTSERLIATTRSSILSLLILCHKVIRVLTLIRYRCKNLQVTGAIQSVGQIAAAKQIKASIHNSGCRIVY
jgi:hypothetical protein